jgi:hypothetical protein
LALSVFASRAISCGAGKSSRGVRHGLAALIAVERAAELVEVARRGLVISSADVAALGRTIATPRVSGAPLVDPPISDRARHALDPALARARVPRQARRPGARRSAAQQPHRRERRGARDAAAEIGLERVARACGAWTPHPSPRRRARPRLA